MRGLFLVSRATAMLVAAAACVTPGTASQLSTGEIIQDGSVGLLVENQNFADMDVYLVTGGMARRVGTVTGNSNSQFRLDRSFFPTSQLSVIATPIGGHGIATTGRLSVAPGQQIDFTIAPMLQHSFGWVQ